MVTVFDPLRSQSLGHNMTHSSTAALHSWPSHLATRLAALATAACIVTAIACEPTRPVNPSGSSTGVGVVNAFSAPVDLLVDGTVRASAIPSGHYTGVDATLGVHTVSVRPTAGGASVVHTPHNTAPLEDGKRPDDHEILQAGVFNLGFIAMRRCEDSRREPHLRRRAHR